MLPIPKVLHPWLLRRLAAPPRLQRFPDWKIGDGNPSSDFVTRWRKEVWRQFESPAVLRWLNGLRVHVHPHNETSECLVKSGLFEPNEMTWLAERLRPGMTFIDVGANMGLYSLFAASVVGPTGRVLAIEPSRREFIQLQANIELNRLGNVVAVQAAAGRDSGEALLQVAEAPHTGHNTLGTFVYPGIKRARTETVPLRPLDDLADEAGLAEVHVIKIDVEGEELGVLQGAGRIIEAHHPALLIEAIETTLDARTAASGSIREWLSQRGYGLFELGPEDEPLIRAPQHKRYESMEMLVALPDR